MDSVIADEKHSAPILLPAELMLRLDEWSAGLTPLLSGKVLSPSELVAWLLSAHAEQLSSDEVAALQVLHYDPLRAMHWAVEQAKRLSTSGAPIDPLALFTAAMPNNGIKRKLRRSTKRSKHQRKPKSEPATVFTEGDEI